MNDVFHNDVNEDKTRVFRVYESIISGKTTYAFHAECKSTDELIEMLKNGIVLAEDYRDDHIQCKTCGQNICDSGLVWESSARVPISGRQVVESDFDEYTQVSRYLCPFCGTEVKLSDYDLYV